MTVETYVYAIVGVHCKDQCTTSTLPARGCDHIATEKEFCAECGKPTWTSKKTEVCLSDKLEHLQLWHGGDDGPDDSAISLIYSPMCGPSDFVVGRVLENMDSGDCAPTKFDVLTDEEYTEAYEQTKAALEPLGLWDPEKFGYMLYAISM